MSDTEKKHEQKDILSDPTVKAVFMACVGGASALASFAYALGSVKKNDNSKYDSETVLLHKEGTRLAIRALKWGTIYAVLGVGTLMYGSWKLSGAKTKEEFRMKMGNCIPAVPKNAVPEGRTEFESISDFMQYLDDTYSTKPETTIISENTEIE